MRNIKYLAASLLIAISLLTGCGANAPAIEKAEVACLRADLASLKAKIQGAGISEDGVIQLTEGEIACAFEALSAKAASGTAAN